MKPRPSRYGRHIDYNSYMPCYRPSHFTPPEVTPVRSDKAPRMITKEVIADIVKLKKDGYSVEEISKQVSVTPVLVGIILHCAPDKPSVYCTKKPPLTKEQVLEVKRRLEEGELIAEITQAMNIGKSSVRVIINGERDYLLTRESKAV